MRWIDRLTRKTPAAPATQAPTLLPSTPVDNVHHEYFVGDEPTNGRWGWLCRVYAHDGTPHQMTGAEETTEQARAAALAWAESTKRTLRSIQ